MQMKIPAAKPDNLFGICHALGEAFGFNPIFLRIAIVFGILVNFEVTALAYLGAGLAVLAATMLAKLGRRRRIVTQG
jgi:phage shock protein PspC (stress-responsive transcriptional regulator)